MKWSEVEIGQLCLTTDQVDPRDNPDKPFEYIDISSVDKSSKVISQTQSILGSEAPSRARKIVQAGDVLVSTVRPNLNTVAVVPESLDQQIASTGFCVLRPNAKYLFGKYLFYCTLTPDFISFLTARMRGANYPAVTDAVVREAPIPWPPISEQRRIVEILDQADAIRKKRAEADAKSDRILPALFHKMFGDPITNSLRWKEKSLEAVCHDIYRYPSYYGIQYVPEGVAEIRGELLREDGTISDSPELLRYIAKQTAAQYPRTTVKTGDLVMSVRGTIGKLGIVPESLNGANITANLLRIAPKHTEVIGPYLYAFLAIGLGRTGINLLATNTTIATIKAEDIRKLKVLCPPMALQEKFGERLELLRKNSSQSQAGSKKIDELFECLLHNAFSGDLTAKWREAHMKELLVEMEQQAKLLGASC